MTVNLTAGSPQASHPTADVSATSAGPLTPQQRLQAEVTELNQDIAFTKGRLQAAEVAWALGPGTGADHVSQLRMELNMLTKTRIDALHQIRDLRRAARQSARSGVGTS